MLEGTGKIIALPDSSWSHHRKAISPLKVHHHKIRGAQEHNDSQEAKLKT